MEWFWNAMWGYLGLLAAPFVLFAIVGMFVGLLAVILAVADSVRRFFTRR